MANRNNITALIMCAITRAMETLVDVRVTQET